MSPFPIPSSPVNIIILNNYTISKCGHDFQIKMLTIEQVKQTVVSPTALSPSHPEVLHEPRILPDVNTSSHVLGSCTERQKWELK